MRKNDPKVLTAWCLYDWANSAFATTMLAAVLPIFFRNVSAATFGPAGRQLATSAWGYLSSLSMLLVALLSLVLGPLADYGSAKKRFLAVFACIGIVFSSLLGLTGPGDWVWAAVFFVLAEIGFAVGEVFYDAMLPHLAGPEAMDRVSARGYALGYVGGGLLLALNVAWIAFLPRTAVVPGGPPVPVLGMQWSFFSVGVWWAVFSVPLFRRVPEVGGEGRPLGGANPFRLAFGRLRSTFSEVRRYRPLFLFLLAFWFYNDGIGTIIKMATAYGDEIGITLADMSAALVITQFVGFPCTLLFGRLAGRTGAKAAVLLALGVYTLIAAAGFFMTRAWHFYALAALVGAVQGGAQALSRSLFAAMVPRTREAEFFGFFSTSAKFAGIAGPLVFGLVSQLAGGSRLSILSLIVFFVAGALLLARVDVAAGRREAAAGER
jgi:UMF1 family MFS transporter